MANPSYYQGPGDYLNVNVTLDAANQQKILTVSLLQINGAYPNLQGNIFVYTNTGTTALGQYVGVANLDELSRFQVFNSTTPVPIFGNKYLLYNTAIINLALNVDYTIPLGVIETGIKNLNAEIKLQATINSIVYLPKV